MNESPSVTQEATGSQIAQAAAGGIAIVNSYQWVAPLPADPSAVEAALRKLDELPVDQVLHAATALPPRSRMPLRSNPLFVGRDEDLQRVALALRSGAFAAITGIRGVGKTQLASEFVHRYGTHFAGGVFWLSFAKDAAVPSEVAVCGGPGHLELRPDFPGLGVDDQVRAVLAAWASPLPRLLVFDNCEEPALLERWLPPTGGCRVLVTSWRDKWPAALGMQLVPLATMSRHHSVALLERHLAGHAPDVEALATIAEELGDLPLALHLAGSVLAEYPDSITPRSYLGVLREPGALRSPWLESSEPSPTGHVQQVAATFALSYERLETADPRDSLALKLLRGAGFLAPGEPIPHDLLLAVGEVAPGDLAEGVRVERAFAKLLALGLAERGAGGNLRLHRLVAAYVRERAADSDVQQRVELEVVAAARALLSEPTLAHAIAMQPQLRYVTSAAAVRQDAQSATLAMVLGEHLMRLGDYVGAREQFSAALGIRMLRLGRTHAETVVALRSVGFAHKERGEYIEAQRCYERALAIDPDDRASLTDLAFVLKDRRLFAESQEHFERALELVARATGIESAEAAVCLNNLGLLLKDRRAYDDAQHCFKRALAIVRTLRGEDHVDMIPSINNIAFALKDSGRYVEAQARFEEALQLNERVHGARHPDTIASLTNLAFLMLDRALTVTGHDPAHASERRDLFESSRARLERAVAILVEMVPEGHPRIAEGYDSLGELLLRQGDLRSARQYFENALAIREKSLGPAHPESARTLGNLGRTIAEMAGEGGDALLREALVCLEEALARFDRTLGVATDSVDAQRTREALADVRRRLQRSNDFWRDAYAANAG